MTVKEKVNDLFKRYGIALSAEEVKMAEATLEDGTMIYTDSEEWVSGVNVYVLAEDGTKVNVPVGEYTLNDGRIVVVTEEGIVAEIREAAAMSSDRTFTKEEVASMMEDVAKAIRAEFAETEKVQLSAHEAVKTELSEAKKKIQELELKMARTPRAVSEKKVEAVDLKQLPVKERVTAIFNKYNG